MRFLLIVVCDLLAVLAFALAVRTIFRVLTAHRQARLCPGCRQPLSSVARAGTCPACDKPPLVSSPHDPLTIERIDP